MVYIISDLVPIDKTKNLHKCLEKQIYKNFVVLTKNLCGGRLDYGMIGQVQA
jgi:hypothetical protein